MKAKPSNKPLEFVEAMLGTLYKNPSGYARTVGELDGILWVTHHIWANLADRESEFIKVRCDIYSNASAKRIERIRADPISSIKSLQSVINRWKKIDAK